MAKRRKAGAVHTGDLVDFGKHGKWYITGMHPGGMCRVTRNKKDRYDDEMAEAVVKASLAKRVVEKGR